ncbi:hypothetical protein GmHk_09G025494 [Glycine max]|nr:hypothetical protein GmHk_09G025494 [Glycine max]
MENESRSFANQESFSYKGVPCPFIYLPTLSLNWIANMRQANRVAHSLARASRLYSSPYHFDFIPPCIETLIINDMI